MGLTGRTHVRLTFRPTSGRLVSGEIPRLVTTEENKMKQPTRRKAVSLSEALDQALNESEARGDGRRRKNLYKLQRVLDLLDKTGESEVFCVFLYSDHISITRLCQAVNNLGISVTYQTVWRWRKLHQAQRLVFQQGKVYCGHRSQP